MDGEEEKLAGERKGMVEFQLRARGIRDGDVLRAFEQIPRERFVPPDKLCEAYADHPVPIGCGQTVSQPLVVAMMMEELAIRPHHRILDVGSGSGYQTALLAELAAHVYAIERIDELTTRAAVVLADLNITNVTMRTGDGSLGWAEEAPFDGIICGAAAPRVPESWIGQLADGGRIVLPVGGSESQTIVVVQKEGEKITTREVCDVRFVKLLGQEAWPP